ncbi:Glutathione S-transferase [Mycena indigotica]|uniref:Glutathione S-transferase n=1 Tax=Mycena indigotica TaxID=2126181 RepID=A0A8H6VYT9_9AGAR|nr:Glutathione S-transferase [Mycena indigotica]KAF7296836.1 Glutathione S-transferase [Mycena indigotica]
MMTPERHIIDPPPIYRISELHLPYTLKTYQRDPLTRRGDPTLKSVSPLGKYPVIVVGNAVLVEHFGGRADAPGLVPPRWAAGQEGAAGGETAARLRYRHLLHYAEGSLMPLLVVNMIVTNVQAPEVTATIQKGYTEPNLMSHFQFIEGLLSDGGHTFADRPLPASCLVQIFLSASLSSSLSRAKAIDRTCSLWTHIHTSLPIIAHVELIQQEAGYQRAVSKIVSVLGENKVTPEDD